MRSRIPFRALAVSALSALLLAGAHSPARADTGDILRTLTERSWDPAATSISYGAYQRAGDPRVHVMTDERGAVPLRKLAARFKERIVIESGSVRTFTGGREYDASPHYGGASILANVINCTSGFSVQYPNGARGSVTAAHCYDNDEWLISGLNIYGFTKGKNYPPRDVLAIQGGGAYTNKIYTDPGSPITRTVTAKADPVAGADVCASGRLTKARCSVSVIDVHAVFCPPTAGCVVDVMLGFRAAGAAGAPGDSGGPVYTPTAGSGATANGIIIGGDLTGQWIYAEKVSKIEAHLGAKIATTP
ncbi:hypothetical protein GCM10027589_15390 [Actinocorallia lasiicapitis]